MLNPFWSLLSVVGLVGGTLLILWPKVLIDANKRLNKAVATADDLILHHRHVFGTLLLIVGYLCFHLALLVSTF